MSHDRTGWFDRCEDAAAALDQPTRQQLLDAIWKGRTIGEAREEVGISLEAACGVINHNIVTADFARLNRTTL